MDGGGRIDVPSTQLADRHHGAKEEAEGAGGRDNTEALTYRVGVTYKKSEEANKTIWAVKKPVEKKGDKEDGW